MSGEKLGRVLLSVGLSYVCIVNSTMKQIIILYLYLQNLLKACDEGNIQKVKALLKTETNVNIQDQVPYIMYTYMHV